ncbi:MAG: UDP-3-O-(3-hydroxymyristoyl)glucosamine N-acyltransferase [Pseudomonadota bacterium]|nr:UDP-3-O-(3-hydroxymyristoyl)glucosamine N-acyltransferase [Pseudomonadota bacterium]
MALTLSEIASRLGGEVLGDGATMVTGIGTLERATADEIAFLANPVYRPQLNSTRAGAVIVGPADRDLTPVPRILAVNPYAYFARVAALFAPALRRVPGCHPTAIVEADATIAASAQIGPLAYIGRGAKVGERAVIHPQVQIGANTRIGADSIIYANSVIYHNCEIGERVIIHSGAVIGADGFGFAFDADHWLKVPQVGRVVIGSDVEVGANTTIDRGAIDDTVIESGVKLDNQIQIGHNVRVGAHTAIAGCAAVAGSASIGRHCRIGGGAGIVGHVDICDGVTVTAQTLVTKSITQPGTYSGGLPHMGNRDWLTTTAHLRRLDKLLERVEALEREVKHIRVERNDRNEH